MDKRKWNVWWLVREGYQKYEVSYRDNPVDCCNLESLLRKLMGDSPKLPGIELAGIRIEEVLG